MIDNPKYMSSAPYIKGKSGIDSIWLSIILSLIPAIAFAIYKYQINAVIHFAVTVSVCICADYLYVFFVKRENYFNIFETAVTGILLSLMLAAYAPYYVGVIGGLSAILFKRILGEFTDFYINPAVCAKCFLMAVFFDVMRKYSNGTMHLPVEILNKGKTVDNFNMMIGNVDGGMGEICVIALLIGAVILVITGVCDIYIPAAYIFSFIIIMTIFGDRKFDMTYIVSQLAGGGFIMAVWYLASDLKSSPVTIKGQIIYGLILGVLTSIIRLVGFYTEAIYFVLLVCNLLVPLIERFTIPNTFYDEKK